MVKFVCWGKRVSRFSALLLNETLLFFLGGNDVSYSNATVADFNSTAALVELDVLPSSELLLVMGYVYFYREDPFRNATKFDGRHGCGKDG